MTREELRDYVDEQRSLNMIPYHVYSTLIDGIDTLEQEPCEDAVSRAEVIDELNRLGRNAFKDDTEYDRFFAFLDNLSSVTPTRKKGKWIHGHCGVDDYIRCSECGREVVQNIVTLEGDLPEDAFTLCPFCGEDMRGEKDDSN